MSFLIAKCFTNLLQQTLTFCKISNFSIFINFDIIFMMQQGDNYVDTLGLFNFCTLQTEGLLLLLWKLTLRYINSDIFVLFDFETLNSKNGKCSEKVTIYFSIYYNMLLGWVIYFLVHSLTPTSLPGSGCDNSWKSQAVTPSHTVEKKYALPTIVAVRMRTK